MDITSVGAILFGVVVGWITYRTLRRAKEGAALSDIAAVIGAVGGAAITGLFDSETLFAWYAIGLFVGFFGYLIIGVTWLKDTGWLGSDSE
jgi:uncharacterized membrane protein YeaQ/YmgE (transglycosylase-associated protein family)